MAKNQITVGYDKHKNEVTLHTPGKMPLRIEMSKDGRDVELIAHESLKHQPDGVQTATFHLDEGSECFENQDPPETIVLDLVNKPTHTLHLKPMLATLGGEPAPISKREADPHPKHKHFPHLDPVVDDEKFDDDFTKVAGFAFTNPTRPAHDHTDMHMEC